MDLASDQKLSLYSKLCPFPFRQIYKSLNDRQLKAMDLLLTGRYVTLNTVHGQVYSILNVSIDYFPSLQSSSLLLWLRLWYEG